MLSGEAATHGGKRPGAGGAPRTVESKDYAKHRARKEKAIADLREMEVKEAKKDLLRATDVAKVWADAANTTKARLLALPSRLAPDLVHDEDVRSIEKKLKEAVHEILTELAANAGE